MVRLICILLFSICSLTLHLFAYNIGDVVLLSGRTQVARGGVITLAGQYVVENVKTENATNIQIIYINGMWLSGRNMQYISLVPQTNLHQFDTNDIDRAIIWIGSNSNEYGGIQTGDVRFIENFNSSTEAYWSGGLYTISNHEIGTNWEFATEPWVVWQQPFGNYDGQQATPLYWQDLNKYFSNFSDYPNYTSHVGGLFSFRYDWDGYQQVKYNPTTKRFELCEYITNVWFSELRLTWRPVEAPFVSNYHNWASNHFIMLKDVEMSLTLWNPPEYTFTGQSGNSQTFDYNHSYFTNELRENGRFGWSGTMKNEVGKLTIDQLLANGRNVVPEEVANKVLSVASIQNNVYDYRLSGMLTWSFQKNWQFSYPLIEHDGDVVNSYNPTLTADLQCPPFTFDITADESRHPHGILFKW